MLRRIIAILLALAAMGSDQVSSPALAAWTPVSGPLTIPPPFVITNGNVAVGVSDRYGGAIVYYRDRRIADPTSANGNIVNYAQAGALFQNALFLLPIDPRQQQLCNAGQQQNGICAGTLPNNNPTQGGYLADGWAGNPNGAQIGVAGNTLTTASRLVNYNYAYIGKPLSADNEADWQTDFWQDSRISFDPLVPDVVVVDTRLTYCKDTNARCAHKPADLGAFGLPSFFALGKSGTERVPDGPYARVAYQDDTAPSGIVVRGGEGQIVATHDSENWAAVLQAGQDAGLGLSVEHYQPYLAGQGYTLSAAPYPYITATMADLGRFVTSGVSLVSSPGSQVFELQPGGWFEFRTYAATGNTATIRANLLKAQATDAQLPMPNF